MNKSNEVVWYNLISNVPNHAYNYTSVSILVIAAFVYQKWPRGGYSLVDGIRGCSKVKRCFFIIFGISMGGFPFQTQCAQFAKLGEFWKIWPKKRPICCKLGVFCGNLVQWWVTISRFLRYRDGQKSEVYFEHPRTKIFEESPSPGEMTPFMRGEFF